MAIRRAFKPAAHSGAAATAKLSRDERRAEAGASGPRSHAAMIRPGQAFFGFGRIWTC
jgi:hypothetical protein